MNPEAIHLASSQEAQPKAQAHFFFCACDFPNSQAWETCPHLWPLQPEGAAVFVITPGKEKRSFVEQLEKAPVPKAASSSSCQWSLQRGPQKTACQLFSGLRKSGFLPPWLGRGTWVTGRRPGIYTERSKEGWEMSDLSLIENRGLRAGRNLHGHPTPSGDEKVAQ